MASGTIQPIPATNSYTLGGYFNRVTDIDSVLKSSIRKYGKVVVLSISAKALTSLTESQTTIYTLPSDVYPPVQTIYIGVINHNGTLRTVWGNANSNGNVNIVHGGLSQNDEIYGNAVYIVD